MNRHICPRQSIGTSLTFHIMWTSTCIQDMTVKNTVPRVTMSENVNATSSQYLSEYVTKEYEGVCSPGFVVNEDGEDVEVKCIYHVR